MADKSLVISNFKYGLDTRRAELVAQPGTLAVCENAHVTPGATIEKRMAFVRDANDYPSNTFGLQTVATGLVVFGSDAAPSGTLPAGVTYQRLQHPTVGDGGLYDPSFHAMTAVVASCNFQGNAFVIATFADGRSFLYYNGAIIDSSRNGVVMEATTSLITLANAFARQINAIGNGWSAVANVDANGASLPGSVMITSPPGIYFTPATTFSSIDGLFGALFVDKDNAGTAAIAATTKFLVINGAVGVDTFSVYAPRTAASQMPQVTLCSAILCGATATATATAIANAINSVTALTGYSAATDGADTVFVIAPLSFGVFTLLLEVITTGTADSGSTTAGLGLSLSVSPTSIHVIVLGHVGGAPRNVHGSATATASGGTTPYTYEWSEMVSGSGNGIILTNKDTATCTFSKVLPINTSVSGSFQCKVTDSSSPTPGTHYVYNFSVFLDYESSS